MTGAIGKGKKKVHCRRGSSRLRDTSGELFEKTLHDKKERFTLADLVVEIVMGLEELLQFCQSQRATDSPAEAQPERHALVPKPGGHFLATEASKGPETLQPPETELFIQAGSGLGDDEGELIQFFESLLAPQMPDLGPAMERGLGSEAGEGGRLAKADHDLEPERGEAIVQTRGALVPLRRWLGREIESENAGPGFFDPRHPAESRLEQHSRRGQFGGRRGTVHLQLRAPGEGLHRRDPRLDPAAGGEGIATEHNGLALRVIDEGRGHAASTAPFHRLEAEIAAPDDGIT